VIGLVITLTALNCLSIWRYYKMEGRFVESDRGKTRKIESLHNQLNTYLADLDEAKLGRLHDASIHADQLHASRNKAHRQEEYIQQLKNELGAYQLDSLTKSEWRKQIDGLQNEIDGLNVDKLHLKSELAKYRAIHEKRKAQKAANMRRFRAKQKEAKG